VNEGTKGLKTPDHYFRLRPFRSLFETGLPILLYHKMGKAALLDRRKGLFVSRHLFASQLSELTQAGFGFGKLGDAYSTRKIVITFDDGYATCFEQGIDVLETFGCTAIQFLVSGRIGKANDWDGTGEAMMDLSQVREWLGAGHQIGSHTVSHPDLTRLRLMDAREEIQASRKWLEDSFGVPVSHFSYPLGAFNDRIVEIVAEAGYSTAVTSQFGVNDVGTDVHRLRRILAYRSLRESFRSLVRRDVR
jgi:peptidoglycan/xylan/chitin deacetylase (PgdA/CDA1 family)